MNKLNYVVKFAFALYSVALSVLIYSIFTQNKTNFGMVFNPCENIISISSQENKIFINFKQKLAHEYNPYHLSKHFSFHTKVFNEKLFFPSESFVDAFFHKDTNVFEIDLPFPFIQNYTLSLYCHDIKEKLTEPPSNQQILYQKDFNVSITDFQTNVYTTQVKCDGDNINNRVCEASNLTVVANSIIFTSPAHFRFPENFINLGSRNIVFGKNTTVLGKNLYIKHTNFFSDVVDFIPRSTLVFIMSEPNENYQNTFFNRLNDVYYPIYKHTSYKCMFNNYMGSDFISQLNEIFSHDY